MEKKELVQRILTLKKARKALILAHNYQIPEIQDLADFVGDSLELAQRAQAVKEDLIVFCGVDFMAEMAKILNPGKKVLIPSTDACCPMAAQLDAEELEKAKKAHPKAKIVLYVNSSAEAKALADCCCTSANAAKIVDSMKSDEVIFGPDANLAYYVQKKTGKKVIPIPAKGFCYVHNRIQKEDVQMAKGSHPYAKIVAHPECLPEVQDYADVVASTSQMMRYASKTLADEFVIVTEEGMVHRLRKMIPSKKFYPVSDDAICVQQKKITLEALLECLEKGQFEVKVPEGTRLKSLKSLECMLKLSV